MIKLTDAQREAVLKEVRYHKPDISNPQKHRIIDAVEFALIEYQGKFRSQSADQITRLKSAIVDIDHAISKALIDELWQSAENETPQFADQKAVLDWLASEPAVVASVMKRQGGSIISALWKARVSALDQIENIEMVNKAMWFKDWGNSDPDIRSTSWIQKSPDNAQLLFDLARTWVRFVDPSFSIGSNSGSSNYTRFIRCVLDAVGIEKHVSEAAIRNFSRSKIEPLLLTNQGRKKNLG